jgi:hypothetical protein
MSATIDTRVKSSERDMIERGMQGQRLPRRYGAMAGFFGSLAIIAVVTIILMANGRPLFEAPILIASVMMGTSASGPLAIALGTVIHLVMGTALGVGFAIVMPPIYRVFWIVAGMIYGVAAFMVSALVVLPLFTPDIMAAQGSVGVLLIAHVVYGFILGVIGSTYGMFWGRSAVDAE